MAQELTEVNIEEPAEPAATAETPRGGASSPAEPQTGGAAGEAEGCVPDVEALLRSIEEWKQKAAENQDLAMRARAELENLRKRTTRDVESAHKYGLERFVNELLPVLDSIELGIAASQSAGDVAALRQGMELTVKMFGDCLQRLGVAAVNPVGEKFNPEKHQALSAQEAADTEPGTILSVMQKGYELNGRLVRPAMVVVAK